MDSDAAAAFERLKDEAPFGFAEDLVEIATFVGQSEQLRADARGPSDDFVRKVAEPDDRPLARARRRAR